MKAAKNRTLGGHTSVPTYGEILFERYLKLQGIAFEREPKLPGIAQRIDFVVDHPECGKILLEVKDIENMSMPSGAFDPHRHVRSHIDAGKDKFKQTADYVCALVLAAPPGSFVQLEDPLTIMGAMYGNLAFRMPVNTETGVADPDRIEFVYSVGEGKMIRKNEIRNTRIAAVITITDHNMWFHARRKYIKTEDGRSKAERVRDVQNHRVDLPNPDETLPGVTIWENAVASKKLPKNLFRGEMDAWWEVSSDGRQLPTFIGARRRALNVDEIALDKLRMS